MIPILVSFDRYSQVTGGLVSINTSNMLVANGLSLESAWLSNQIWIGFSAITTGWTQCCAPVVTSWTDTYSQPSTGWTAA